MMFRTTGTGRLILASSSPRRRLLLGDLGLTFEIITADVDERPLSRETPPGFVSRISMEKCMNVSSVCRDGTILGADTVVVLDGEILGKPADRESAKAMLKRLSGRWHEVWTGFCIFNRGQAVTVQRAVKTDVLFSRLTDKVCDAYVKTGEPMDKAGAYGIQGVGGVLVKRIRGSYTNVVGLPLAEVIKELESLCVITPADESPNP